MPSTDGPRPFEECLLGIGFMLKFEQKDVGVKLDNFKWIEGAPSFGHYLFDDRQTENFRG